YNSTTGHASVSLRCAAHTHTHTHTNSSCLSLPLSPSFSHTHPLPHPPSQMCAVEKIHRQINISYYSPTNFPSVPSTCNYCLAVRVFGVCVCVCVCVCVYGCKTVVFCVWVCLCVCVRVWLL